MNLTQIHKTAEPESALDIKQQQFELFIEEYTDGNPDAFIAALKEKFNDIQISIIKPSGSEYGAGPINSRKKYVTVVFVNEQEQLDIQFTVGENGLVEIIIFRRDALQQYTENTIAAETKYRSHILSRIGIAMGNGWLEAIKQNPTEILEQVLDRIDPSIRPNIRKTLIPRQPMKIWH
jgi:hypothetical protein